MRRTVLVVVALSVWLVPVVALAHPFVPGTVPVDSAAVLTLDMAHGCFADGASHDGPEQEATREVSVRFPPEIDVRTVVDDFGFTVGVPEKTDMYDEWTFVAPDGVDVSAPTFAFAVVVNAEATDTLWLQVFQGCDTHAHRWIATPDAPGGEPGVRVRLAVADPAAPAVGAPPRDIFVVENAEEEPAEVTADADTNAAVEGDTDDTNGRDDIDFIGVDIPQTADAWVWYVLIAGVVGVLLAKRASGRSRR